MDVHFRPGLNCVSLFLHPIHYNNTCTEGLYEKCLRKKGPVFSPMVQMLLARHSLSLRLDLFNTNNQRGGSPRSSIRFSAFQLVARDLGLTASRVQAREEYFLDGNNWLDNISLCHISFWST